MTEQTTPKVAPEGQPQQLIGMFQALVEMANVGIIVLDRDNYIQYANRMSSHITGYEQTSLIGRPFSSLLDERNRRLFLALKESAAPHLSKLYQGVEISTAHSTTVISEMSLAPLSSGAEEVCFIYFRDITARKGVARELQESEQRYVELFDRVEQGIFISSKEGRFVECNRALLTILGYETKDELLEKDLARDVYANPQDRAKYQQTMDREGTVRNYEVEFKRKNGETIPILLNSHVIKDDKGEVVGYQGLIIDVSENIRMQRELDKKNRFLSNLLESSVDCIVAADTNGTVIFFNKAAEKLTGYAAEEVIGKFHITRFYPLGMAKEVMRKLRSDEYGGRGKLEHLPITMLSKSGEEIPVSTSASIVYEGDKELASLGIFTDLREKLRMEKDLQEAQLRLLQTEKMASLGSLAAGVAHEINNPLGGILIYASLLMEEFEDQNDPRVQDLKRIVEEGTRCKDIVKSLLEFGRQTESRLEPININQAINDGLFFLEKQALFHNIKIVKHLDPSLPTVHGDPNQLKQVFMNMMVNGGEAMVEAGGTLTITTRPNADDSSVLISFQDTGTGIPPEIQSKIFDPFFTTKDIGKGTGLGLSTSYGIVQSHHGAIELESEVGKGTTFTIILPVSIESVE